MAKDFVNHFLSEKSLEDLEKSKGAVLLIHKPKILEKHKQTIKDREEELVGLREELKKAQENMDKAESFFRNLFGGKKAKEEKIEARKNLCIVQAKIERIETDLKMLKTLVSVMKKEIQEFTETLHYIGLTQQDIIDGYNRIKWNFAEKEKEEQEAQRLREYRQAKAQEELNSQKSTSKPQRMTPREKFEARQRKHEQMIAGKPQDPTQFGK